MKKPIMLMFAFVLAVGFAYSQSNKNYKSRNHKLNKHQKYIDTHSKKTVVMATGEMSTNVSDYMERNSKFHNKTREHSHLFMKAKVDNDYRALNHKLSKNNKNKEVGKPAPGNVLTKK